MSTYADTPVPTEDQTRKDVTTEVEGEIKGQTGPLQGQIGQTERDRAATDKYLQDLFAGAQADAGAAAGRMRGDYSQAIASERDIMGAASDKLNQLRQQRAADAQKLAQQIGGYVPIGDFTSPVDLESSLFSADSAGSLLRATGLAEAGVQHAEAFSGQVLPLLRVKEMEASRAKYDAHISEIKDQIAAIEAQKGGMINERTRKRMLEDRQFALDQANSNRTYDLAKKQAAIDKDNSDIALKEHVLNKQKAQHDWLAARKSYGLEERRLALSAAQLYGAEVVWNPKTKTYDLKKDGKSTLERDQMNQVQTAARTAAINERKDSAFKLMEAYMNPGVENVSTTQFVPVAGPDAAGAFWNGNQWVRAISVKQQVGHAPVDDPQQLVELLIGQGIPRLIAEKTVKTRYPTWTPGTAAGDPNKTGDQEAGKKDTDTTFTHQQLIKFSPNRVIQIAHGIGFQQKPPPSITKDAGPQRTESVEDYNRRRANGDRRPRQVESDKQYRERRDRYNTNLKNFYIYWVMKIQAEGLGDIPGKKTRG